MAAAAAAVTSFEHMGLDGRLLRAVAELGWAAPTAIQAEAIPLALEGRDVLARARTGSGKTAAYGLPVLQRLLRVKAAPAAVAQAVRALVLVPSQELCRQAACSLRQLAAFCARDVRVADVCAHSDIAALRPVLAEQPDVVVGTPGRVLALLRAGAVLLRCSLEVLVLDEADVLLHFGFGEDIKGLLCHLPKIYQALLMSATFSPDVDALKELVLHNPVLLLPPERRWQCSAGLRQLVLRCGAEEDKFLLLYALLRVPLLRGRALLSVGAVGRCYRVRLFLEQFGIAACALSAELPAASVYRGVYDYIVATDEESALPTEPTGPPHSGRGRGRAGSRDPEYSVARGIDFQNVAAVINFDVPTTVESYIHRVGRTARAGSAGTALTFVLPEERELMARIEDALTGESGASLLQPYKFCMEEIEALRYRCRDAMRSVTKQAVKEARLREIREELLNSEKLKTYFEDNPRDLHALRHDRALHPATVQPHLRNLPEYLLPPALRAVAKPELRKRRRLRPPHSAAPRRAGPRLRRTANPLQSFRFRRHRSQRRSAQP